MMLLSALFNSVCLHNACLFLSILPLISTLVLYMQCFLSTCFLFQFLYTVFLFNCFASSTDPCGQIVFLVLCSHSVCL